MIIKALRGEPLPVYGRGENVRDWLHVEDHVEALVAVVERGRPGETYFIGGGAERTNLDVVRTIAALVDEMAPPLASGAKRSELISFVADRPGHDFRYAMDISEDRARARLAAVAQLRDGAARDRGVVPGERRVVAAADEELFRRAARRGEDARAGAGLTDAGPGVRRDRPGGARARARGMAGRARR